MREPLNDWEDILAPVSVGDNVTDRQLATAPEDDDPLDQPRGDFAPDANVPDGEQ
jgi:hypothetical protein